MTQRFKKTNEYGDTKEKKQQLIGVKLTSHKLYYQLHT